MHSAKSVEIGKASAPARAKLIVLSLDQQSTPLPPMATALQMLQNWILGLRKTGLASTTSDQVITIEPAATRRFCIGIVESRVFFGVQMSELEWFQTLQWLHVAVRASGTKLSFVSEQTSVEGNTIPCFALSLETGDRALISKVANQSYLDVRKIGMDESGNVNSISKKIFFTISIVLTKEEHTIDGLMCKKFMTGYANRSPMRTVKK